LLLAHINTVLFAALGLLRYLAAQSGFLCRRRSCPRRELPAEQLGLFAAKPPVLEELQKLDISSVTPLDAITKLYELQQKAKEG